MVVRGGLECNPRPLSGAGAWPTLAQAPHQPGRATVDTRIDALLAEWDQPAAPGMSVAVVQDGQVVYTSAVGVASLEHGVPITPATVFDIASVSKQFGAYAIALLEEEGRLDLDDDYRKQLPDMPDFGPTITLRHLLYHRSGIRDWVAALVMSGVRMDDTILFADILRFARRQRDLNFPPGSEHVYSNTGYNLLAETVARVSGMSLRQFTHERIFAPLGMTRTHFNDDHCEIIPNRALSYEPREDGTYGNAATNLTALASSSLHSTAEDLARWVMHLEGAVGASSGALARMNEPGGSMSGDVTYAFGQVTDAYRGLPVLHHSGAWRGFRSHLMRFPSRRFAVVVLANVGSARTGPLARQIADICLADHVGPAADDSPPAAPPTPNAPPEPDEDALRQYMGAYYSHELDTTYVLDVDDSGLRAHHTRHGSIRMLPAGDDLFTGDQWFFGEARFTRDAAGVDGFGLSVDRVRNLRFERRA
jgi:CubicO group peptidase (beta-lactamase class C family)